MSLLPRWFNRLPSPFQSKKGDLAFGKFFSDLDENFDLFSTRPSGLSIYSDDQTLTIEADVPGLSAKEVDVSIDEDGILWIKGERKTIENDKEKNYYRKAQQSYAYCIPLSEEIDISSEPKANYKDGVMKIIFNKKKQKHKEAKKIQVEDEN